MTKPTVGRIVHYFNPAILGRVGLNLGYDGRGEGPYAALVVNDIGAGLSLLVFFPGLTPIPVSGVPHLDDIELVKDKGHWDWPKQVAPEPVAALAEADLDQFTVQTAAPIDPALTGLAKARAVAAANREARKRATASAG